MTARYMAAARDVRYSRDSWVNLPCMGSIYQVVSEIQQKKNVVRMSGKRYEFATCKTFVGSVR